MDDNSIIDLYWKRSESAISETANKYNGYCYSIAYNILANSEDSEEYERKELADCVNRFLDTLPETERSVFLCRYWYLDSVPAIAVNFGFTRSKVTSMLHRTRNKLRVHLEKEGMA